MRNGVKTFDGVQAAFRPGGAPASEPGPGAVGRFSNPSWGRPDGLENRPTRKSAPHASLPLNSNGRGAVRTVAARSPATYSRVAPGGSPQAVKVCGNTSAVRGS